MNNTDLTSDFADTATSLPDDWHQMGDGFDAQFADLMTPNVAETGKAVAAAVVVTAIIGAGFVLWNRRTVDGKSASPTPR